MKIAVGGGNHVKCDDLWSFAVFVVLSFSFVRFENASIFSQTLCFSDCHFAAQPGIFVNSIIICLFEMKFGLRFLDFEKSRSMKGKTKI